MKCPLCKCTHEEELEEWMPVSAKNTCLMCQNHSHTRIMRLINSQEIILANKYIKSCKTTFTNEKSEVYASTGQGFKVCGYGFNAGEKITNKKLYSELYNEVHFELDIPYSGAKIYTLEKNGKTVSESMLYRMGLGTQELASLIYKDIKIHIHHIVYLSEEEKNALAEEGYIHHIIHNIDIYNRDKKIVKRCKAEMLQGGRCRSRAAKMYDFDLCGSHFRSKSPRRHMDSDETKDDYGIQHITPHIPKVELYKICISLLSTH